MALDPTVPAQAHEAHMVLSGRRNMTEVSSSKYIIVNNPKDITNNDGERNCHFLSVHSYANCAQMQASRNDHELTITPIPTKRSVTT